MSLHPTGTADAADAVLADGLRLSETERVRVAVELLSSVDGPLEQLGDDAWLEELRRRIDRVRRGESRGRPWAEVRAEILGSLRR